MKKRPRSHCPIAFPLDLFGDRWSLLILRDIIFKDKCLFREFMDSGEQIASNVLANRLSRLEEDGFITKAQDPNNKKQFIYAPTPMSLDLVPMMLELIRWSAKYDKKTAAPREFIEQVVRDSRAVARTVVLKFKKG